MRPTHRYQITWVRDGERLEVIEPIAAEVARHAPMLAEWYNEDHNRTMMAHTHTLTAMDVRRQFHAMASEGSRPFLLFAGGALVGDADFRRLEGDKGEFAIMIGARNIQGKGLGTKFTVMLHALAFGHLGLSVTYLSIVPANVAGRRCYEKVGYVEDAGETARAYTDSPDDVAMSLTRARFEETQGSAAAQLTIAQRDRLPGRDSP